MQTNHLKQKPRVQPIGAGEVFRRIVFKCIIKRIESDLRFLVANTELCLGQKCGIENAIHSLRCWFMFSRCFGGPGSAVVSSTYSNEYLTS